MMKIPFTAFILAGFTATFSSPLAWETINDKTLVSWIYLNSVTQQGGSVLTLENPNDQFDGIVLGEVVPKKWMAGSNGWNRTENASQQAAYPSETVDSKTMVQMAAVYAGNQITLYRNGILYADYQKGTRQAFGNGSRIVIGRRHSISNDSAYFGGSIEEVRVYNSALPLVEIAALTPNQPSTPTPYGLWTFENGNYNDGMANFPVSVLYAGAHVTGGRLVLDGVDDYLGGPKTDLFTRYTPKYHFAKEIPSMPFDPNGGIYYKGRYHLMYIYNGPLGPDYGHAVTTDLFHWTDLPPSLTDGRNFSGNAFLDKSGRPIIIYNNTNAAKNSIAVAADTGDGNLVTWQKPSQYTPIKTTVPTIKAGDPYFGDPAWGKFDSWDPHGWLEGSTYYSIFGGAQPALFQSSDLENWMYKGPFIDRVKWASGRDCSCPKFFPLGDRHIFMFISHNTGSQFVVGKWENQVFTPEVHRPMCWPGGTYFAPETILDDKGRRIVLAWVSEPSQQLSGKLGVMSLPRVFTLDPQHQVHINPPEEALSLRASQEEQTGIDLASNSEVAVKGIAGDTLEIEMELDVGKATEAGIKVLKSPGGEEETVISYDAVNGTLNLDVSKSSLGNVAHYGWGSTFIIFDHFDPVKSPKEELVQKAPLKLEPGETLNLRIFIDRSIVEVFANGVECVTQRVYPSRNDAKGVALFAKGAPASVKKISGYNLTLADHPSTVTFKPKEKSALVKNQGSPFRTLVGMRLEVLGESPHTLELMDLQGKTVAVRPGSRNGIHAFPSINPGLYLVRIKTNTATFIGKATLE